MPSLACLAFIIAAALLSGCVSSKYKLAPKNTHPPFALNLTATPALPVRPSSASDGGKVAETQPPVEVTVQSVIAYQGPGSWKREAFWDEYVLSISNRGGTPLVIESAMLTDFFGSSNPPGADPWKLEGESKTWWQNVKSSQTGNLLALGAGAVGVGTTLALASFAAGGFFAPATAASTALAGAATVTLVVAPIYAVTVIVINSNNKTKVVAEFQRRRIGLPLTLAPGATAQGSFFFRISPAPSRLALRCRTGDVPFDAIVDLASLSGLHLKSAPASKALNP